MQFVLPVSGRAENPSGCKLLLDHNFDCGPVAQLDRASDFGSEGWGFDSLRGRHLHSISETPHPAAHISISTASFGRVLAAQGAGVILSLRVAIPTTCGK